jgi:hypothetical protein
MENNVKKTSLKLVLAIYFVIFYAVWAVYELIGIPMIDDVIKNEILSSILKDCVIKNLVWTVSAMLLIHHFSSDMRFRLKDMFTEKVNWLKYLPIFVAFTLYLLLNVYIEKGSFKVSEDFGIDTIIKVLFVGITEEMVFRGWLLNATIREDKKRELILLNAVMFLLIHFPIWIRDGLFIPYFKSLSFLFLMILSLIFSYSFLKSKSILVPVVLHMYWDLLAFMF